jgi:hypothetical protein
LTEGPAHQCNHNLQYRSRCNRFRLRAEQTQFRRMSLSALCFQRRAAVLSCCDRQPILSFVSHHRVQSTGRSLLFRAGAFRVPMSAITTIGKRAERRNHFAATLRLKSTTRPKRWGSGRANVTLHLLPCAARAGNTSGIGSIPTIHGFIDHGRSTRCASCLGA